MKQATGRTNPAANTQRMTIRLASDGHSCRFDLSRAARADEIVAVVSSAQTQLVPAEMFDPERSAAYLELAGMAARPSQTVVTSDPAADIVAIMAVESSVLECIGEKIREKIRFTSPLLHTPARTRSVLWLETDGPLLYIKVYDAEGQMRLAEVFTAAGEDEVLYYLTRLRDIHAAETILLAADTPKAVVRLVREHFRKVLCE